MASMLKRLSAAVDGACAALERGELLASNDLEELGREVRRKMSAVDTITAPAYAQQLRRAAEEAREARALAAEDEALEPQAAELEARLETLEARRDEHAQNVPRFGEATREKAAKLLESLDVILLRARAAREANEPARLQETRRLEEDRRAAAEAAAAATAALREKSASFVAVPPRKQTVTSLGASVEDATEATLAARRDAKDRRDRITRKRALLAASETAPRGPEALDAALSRDNNAKAVARIVDAILESPDDERRRRLRCGNDAFQRDFGTGTDSVVTPAQPALEALGFRLRFHPRLKAPTNDDDDDDEEPVFVMAEPDPTNDLDGWKAWFDTLSACKARLDAFLSSSSSPPPRGR
eukprot:CAMPEP_0198649802 /NCGR_PEP_ID=MMETSP1467-20131203/4533_1 /TAXON_ID=1462469 /ORGANISM="unid. sp., Strain CCMP2135" /LENGTH=357 /DNA_ID=CAMNT_0044385605 /DNA_START=11 /DNA_END=1084 /DNA_ORIENTATION=+